MPIRGLYTPIEVQRARAAINYLDLHYNEQVSADSLSEEVRMDTKLLRKLMKELTGLTVHNYLMKVRVEKAIHDLDDFSKTIESIAQKHGFEYSHHFSRIFKQQKGITPTEYRSEHNHNGNTL